METPNTRAWAKIYLTKSSLPEVRFGKSQFIIRTDKGHPEVKSPASGLYERQSPDDWGRLQSASIRSRHKRHRDVYAGSPKVHARRYEIHLKP
jgi:hypothetical protein